MLRNIWCWLRHPYQHTNLNWNGSRQQWMHWCHECGDWRQADRNELVEKMAHLTMIAKDCESGRCGR
jgi:hypothetical protein